MSTNEYLFYLNINYPLPVAHFAVFTDVATDAQSSQSQCVERENLVSINERSLILNASSVVGVASAYKGGRMRECWETCGCHLTFIT